MPDLTPVERAVRGELGNIEDNLHRYRAQQQADPGWRTGNGVAVDAVIADLEHERDALLDDARSRGIEARP